LIAAVLAAMPLLLASVAPASFSPGDRLWGKNFASVTVRQGGEPKPLLPGTRILVSFRRESGRQIVRWRAGCNTFGATLEVTRRRLWVGSGAGTAVGCSEERHRQDEWVGRFIGSDPRWELAGGSLTLRSGDRVVRLRRQARRG
jgi:hypothetical protein